MRIRKHGNPAVTGAGIVARVWDKFYYLVSDKRGTYWVGPFDDVLATFRLATIDRNVQLVP